MRCWRRIGKIGGTDRVRNEVLRRFFEENVEERVEEAGR
jgi:hypothetical protein